MKQTAPNFLTVKDIARKIVRPGEPHSSAVNRIRNWTKEGLLQPIGDKNPGTGKNRYYPLTAIQQARILSILADVVGIPAVQTARQKHYVALIDGIFESAKNPAKRPGLIVIEKDIDGEIQAFGQVDQENLSKHVKQSSAVAFIVIDPKAYVRTQETS